MLYAENVYSVSKPPNNPNRISTSDAASAFMLSYKEETTSKKMVLEFQIDQHTFDENGYLCPPNSKGAPFIIAPTTLEYILNGGVLHIGGRLQKALVLPGDAPTIIEMPDEPQDDSNDASPTDEAEEQTDKNPQSKPKVDYAKLPVGSYVSINYNLASGIGMLNFYNIAVPECAQADDIICSTELALDHPELLDDGRRSVVPYSCRGQSR